jgi:hypothetical protein
MRWGALDSLLGLVDSQRARGLVIAVGEPPQLVFDGGRPAPLDAGTQRGAGRERFARARALADRDGLRY